MTTDPIVDLRRDLARRLDQEDKILLALHIGCGALALGLSGPIEPIDDSSPEET
jgi:hypothetical protein